MDNSKDGMYEIKSGIAIPIKAREMSYILRYGSVDEIVKHRMYIAHIVSLYEEERMKGCAKKK